MRMRREGDVRVKWVSPGRLGRPLPSTQEVLCCLHWLALASNCLMHVGQRSHQKVHRRWPCACLPLPLAGPMMLLGPTMDPKVASELLLRLPHLALRMQVVGGQAQAKSL